MQINITGHHIEVTPALRAYVTEKFQRIYRHFDNVISIDVILKVENHHKQVEAKVNTAGKSLFAQDSGTDMYAAIDGLIDKLDKQVRRRTDKPRVVPGRRVADGAGFGGLLVVAISRSQELAYRR